MWRWSCLLLALTLATTHSPSAQAEKLTIIVGGLERQINMPATLAQRLGFYKEEGLDVDLVGTTAGVDAENELLAGAVQAVVGFYDHTIDLQSKGKNLVGHRPVPASSGRGRDGQSWCRQPQIFGGSQGQDVRRDRVGLVDRLPNACAAHARRAEGGRVQPALRGRRQHFHRRPQTGRDRCRG